MGLSKPAPPGNDNFYDRWTELFLRGFGPVLQAGLLKSGDPPREDPEQSVLALAERAGLSDGDRVLDAGCGVGGPGIIIASHYPTVVIDGVTPSKRQIAIAHRSAVSAGVSDRIRGHLADYQQLPFRDDSFDLVLFFESTGYATDLRATYCEAFRVLKPGGRLYVKDVFCISDPLGDEQTAQMNSFDELWGCARSKTMDESVDEMVRAGFDVESSLPIRDIGTDRFVGSHFFLSPTEGLGVSELGEAFLRQNLDPPIEFGEIKAIRPIVSEASA